MISLADVIPRLADRAGPSDETSHTLLCVLNGFVDMPITARGDADVDKSLGVDVEDETVWGGLFRLRFHAAAEPPRYSRYLVMPHRIADLLTYRTGLPSTLALGFFLRGRDETGYRVRMEALPHSQTLPSGYRVTVYFY